MAVREILLLGNPKLFEVCEPVQEAQLEHIKPIIQRRTSHRRPADRRDETGGLHVHWGAGGLYQSGPRSQKYGGDGALGRLYEFPRPPRKGAASSEMSDYISG